MPDLSYWVLQTIAMMLTAFFIPRLRVSGPLGALGAVIGLSYMNAKFWDAALFFQLPDSLTVHAVTLFLANGVLFWVLVKILPGIEVEGFLPAFIAPIVFTVTSIVINHHGRDIDWTKVYDSVVGRVSHVRDNLETETLK